MTERDLRESSRIEGVFRVKYPSIDRLVVAYSRDLSRGGMFLATDAFLPLNAVIRLEIDLPDDGGRIPVTCRVVFVRDKAASIASGKPVGMGVQFLDLAEDSLGRLAKFVSERSPFVETRMAPTRALDVLVIDDDTVSAERVARSLRLRGDRVRTARDGLHGLAECLRQPPDAIILDVQMPRMDGWQFIRILRSRPSLSSIPVLFLTQLWSEEERLRGYKLGVDDFIPKPAGPEELLARLDRAVDRAQRPGPSLTQRKTLRGDIEQVSVASVLSFLELEKKTGVLLLVGESTARIYVEAGRPLNIELDGIPAPQDPLKAMNLVLDWTTGQFEFAAQDVACADELGKTLTSILLDHARLRDEARR
jgi:uncharacterized protein (TIGR02266 family)